MRCRRLRAPGWHLISKWNTRPALTLAGGVQPEVRLHPLQQRQVLLRPLSREHDHRRRGHDLPRGRHLRRRESAHLRERRARRNRRPLRRGPRLQPSAESSPEAAGAPSPAPPSHGRLDEIAIYGTALSAARVQAHYTPGAPATYASTVLADSPVAYWRLGEASGSSAADSSGNGNGGSYAGGVTLGRRR